MYEIISNEELIQINGGDISDIPADLVHEGHELLKSVWKAGKEMGSVVYRHVYKPIRGNKPIFSN